MGADMDVYFSGEKLYGDDFSFEQLKKWYEEEAEGYSGLVKQAGPNYAYPYHALNKWHGFRHVKLPKDCRTLGVGSAYCEEFLPILPHVDHITSLDPSDDFAIEDLHNVPVSHVRPAIDGKMPFPDNSFDVITCFGVLHHVANVTFVLGECHRVLKSGGVMFLREPIVSMGDWRKPRKGLTKNERGIPYDLFVDMVREHNFLLTRSVQFDFSPLARVFNHLGVSAFSSRFTTIIDRLLSQIFSFNKKYHRVTFLEKFGPASVYMVLRKA